MERLALEEPRRRVRDVAGTGACFFLAANLGRQELPPHAPGHARTTRSDVELDGAGWDDRCAVIQLMRDRLHAPPLGNGDTLAQSLALVIDISGMPRHAARRQTRIPTAAPR